MGANRKDVLPAHSILGASSAYRWMNCPASIREIENVPEVFRSTTSKEADEGTLAHDYLAKLQLGQIGLGAVPEEDDMREAVGYAFDAIRTQVAAAQREAKEGQKVHWVEERFDISHIYPGCFGTGDAIIYYPKSKILKVIDYKHGKGLLVEVVDEKGQANSQLSYYGLGAMTVLEGVGEIQTVELQVIQPRCNHPSGKYIRSVRVSPTYLIDFAFELQEKAEATKDPHAPHSIGEWCRFCPAIAFCEAQNRRALVEAQEEFGAVDENGDIPLPATEAQLEKAMRWLPTLKAWIRGVDKHAYQYVMRGHKIPGYKLVEKRPVRKWADEDAAVKTFLKGGLKDFDIYEPRKIKSPAQIEKILDRDEKKAIQSLILKKSSGLALVPETDKRPEVLAGPEADFDVINADSEEV